MPAYGIMRIEKRNRPAVYGLQLEANRTRKEHDELGREFDRSDIDWELTDQNVHLICTDRWNAEITRQIHTAGVKERKDSIVLLDALYTSSPEWFALHPDREEQVRYFQDCLNFHVREYCQGDASKVINAVVHFDETTPHMQVASIPIYIDEKGSHLSAKTIMGNRSDFRKRQDRFYEQISSRYGMKRGEVKDPAETRAHTTKREWQAAVLEEQITEQETLLAQDIQRRDDLDREIQGAERERLAALRQRDSTLAETDVMLRLQSLKDELAGSKPPLDITVLSSSPERRSITGKTIPATVTIPAAELNAVRTAASNAEKGKAAAAALEKSASELKKQAEEIHRNKIDAREIEINRRVREADERTDQVRKELTEAKSKIYIAERRLQKNSKELDDLKAKHSRILAVLSFFPALWKSMTDKTMKALQLQEAYGQEQNPARKQELLTAYGNECRENKLAGDRQMLEDLEKLQSHNIRKHEDIIR